MRYAFLIGALAISSAAAANPTWTQSYGTWCLQDVGQQAAVDASGRVFAGGSVTPINGLSPFAVLCYSPWGTQNWTYQYPKGTSAMVESLVPTNTGGVVAGGSIYRNDIGEGWNYLVAKLSATGAAIWTTEIHSTSVFDRMLNMFQDAQGNLLLVGLGQQQASYMGTMVVKVDPNGNVLWQRLFAPVQNENFFPYGAALDHSGGVVVGMMGGRIIRYDTNGNLDLDTTIQLDGDGTPLPQIAIDDWNNILIATNDLEIGVDLDGTLIKLLPSGQEIWRVTVEDAAQRGPQVTVGPGGDVFLESGSVLHKFTSNCTPGWTLALPSTFDNGQPVRIHATEKGLFYGGTVAESLLIGQVNPQGSVQWAYHPQGATGDSALADFAVDRNGGVRVVGSVTSAAGDWDIQVLAFINSRSWRGN